MSWLDSEGEREDALVLAIKTREANKINCNQGNNSKIPAQKRSYVFLYGCDLN